MDKNAPKPIARPEEQDVWWGAYAGRTMIPSFVLCGCLTGLILGFALSQGDWHESDWKRFLVQSALTLLWIAQGLRWVYRMAVVNYRLTTARLFKDVGFRRPNNHEIALATVADVLVMRSALEHRLGVGRIGIILDKDSHPALTLEGVRHPDSVASLLRKHVKEARAAVHG